MKNVKNYMYNVSYNVLIMIIPLILATYIARVIGPSGVGLFSYSRAIVMYFGLFAQLGLTMYGSRFIGSVSQDRETLSHAFFEIYSVQLVCTIVVGIAYIIYILCFAQGYFMAFLIMSWYLIGMCFDISWYYFGIGDFKTPLINNVFLRIATCSSIFLFVHSKEDVYIYIAILALERFFTHVILWFFLPKTIDLKIGFLREWKVFLQRHFKANLILFLPLIASQLYKSIDRVMLGRMINITEVGYYENAQSIIQTLLFVITSLGTVMLPIMSAFYKEKKKEEALLYTTYSFEFISFIAMGCIFGVVGVAPLFIPLYYGNQFLVCTELLMLLTPTLLFVGWSDIIRTQYLLPNYRDKEYTIAILLGTIINIVINSILIPRMSSVGAIIGTLAAEFFVMALQFVLVLKELPVMKYMMTGLPYLVFGLLMYLEIQLMNGIVLNKIILLLLEIMVGGITYALLSGGYLYIAHRDWVNQALGMLRGKKDDR